MQAPGVIINIGAGQPRELSHRLAHRRRASVCADETVCRRDADGRSVDQAAIRDPVSNRARGRRLLAGRSGRRADRRRPRRVILGIGPAFLVSLTATNDAILGQRLMGWEKMQSVYGILRGAGFDTRPASLVQALWGIALAIGLYVVWKRRIAYDLKAAALAVCILLVEPYVFLYDVPILAVSIAFLIRLALLTGALPFEGPTPPIVADDAPLFDSCAALVFASAFFGFFGSRPPFAMSISAKAVSRPAAG